MALPMRLTSMAWPTWAAPRTRAKTAISSGMRNRASGRCWTTISLTAGSRMRTSAALSPAATAAQTIDRANGAQRGFK